MPHLTDLSKLKTSEILQILKKSHEIFESPADFKNLHKDKILATLFYEPSTRTQLSFQTAAIKLGGSFVGFSDAESSSHSKGESLTDTIKIIGEYADIIAMRHPCEGAANLAATVSKIPIINAGDGANLHPTQTLCDLFTMQKHKGTLEGLTIGIAGDLLYSRTAHSLVKELARFKNNKFILISTEKLRLPQSLKDKIVSAGLQFSEIGSLQEAIDKLDVLYMTRIQKERFDSQQDYLTQKGKFILDKAVLTNAKQDLSILHPLPRIDEISPEIDQDLRAHYFLQAKYGVFVRMALIDYLLKGNGHSAATLSEGENYTACQNEKCISKFERNLEKTALKGDCKLCDKKCLTI